MNAERLTLKTQEALRRAGDIALEHQHQEISPAHVLAALLEQKDGIVIPLLQRIGAHPDALGDQLDQFKKDLANYQGATASGKMPVASGWDINEFKGVSATDAQYIESRQFSVSANARPIW